MADDQQDMDIDGLEPLEFPPTDMSRLQKGPSGQTVRWIENTTKEPTIYARILAGYDSHQEMFQDLMGLVGIQKIFPMPVHTSPLYIMLSRCNEQNAYRDLYVSSFTTMKYLKQMLFYYFTTYATVAAETSPDGVHETETERIRTVENEYVNRVQLLENDLFDELHVLYTGISREQPVPVETLAQFGERMVKFTYDYFHLMEYCIWKVIDPQQTIELAQLLTPVLQDLQAIRNPTAEEQQVICKSFIIKSLANNTNLQRGGHDRLVKNWFPAATSLVPGQWIGIPLLENYFWFMNVDEN